LFLQYNPRLKVLKKFPKQAQGTIVNIFYNLLPSRLYCRLRDLTGSC